MDWKILNKIFQPIYNLKDKYQNMESKKRTIFSTFLVIAILLDLYISGFLVSVLYDKKINFSIFRIYFNALFTIQGWILSFVVVFVVSILIYFLLNRDNLLAQVKESDSRGIDFAEKGTYGTAEWLNKKDAKKTYEIGNIDAVRGVILGQYGTDGKEVVCLPENTPSNRNILILGSPGTGKSWCYVRNAMFQSIVREESVVVVDPKGELYESTADIFVKKGYKVKVFNLIDTEYSDSWDCMGEVFDPYTGNVSELRVAEFVDTVMKNTGQESDDPFWFSGESNLFKAVVFLYAGEYIRAIQTGIEITSRSMLDTVKEKLDTEEFEKLQSTLVSNDTTINEKKTAFRVLATLYQDENYAQEALNKILKRKSCTITDVYYSLTTKDISSLGEDFKNLSKNDPAKISWEIFSRGSDNVKPAFLQGLCQRLQLLNVRSVRRILSNKDIVLADLGKEKTILYCIISDKTLAMKPISSLFFNFLFKDISDAADHYGAENRKYVNIIADEFSILGSIPQFAVIIATVRSRRINISIILQSTEQLVTNYGTASKTIISCCDTILFLGCNDTETANFISDLCGVSSIRVVSVKDNKTSFGTRGLWQGYSIGEGDGKRPLLNPDEVRRLPRSNVLLYHNGNNILQIQRCGYDLHPFSKMPHETFKIHQYQKASEKYANVYYDAFLKE